MSKVTWVESREEDVLMSHAFAKVNDGEFRDVPEPELTDEEIQASLIDADFVVQMPPVNEYTVQMRVTEIVKPQPPAPHVDRTMVGKTLWFTATNGTEKLWPAGHCYPGCFWVKGDKRMDAPATKDQPFQIDILPGATVSFGVVVPRFPEDKPDALRVSVLENGVGWHTIQDIRMRG